MSTPRALLVEDDGPTRQFIRDVLSGLEINLVIASSLEQARTEARTQVFDILIVDRMLPDGRGLDFIRELRDRDNRMPILVLTALRDVGQRVEGLEAGADDYLGKPFAPLELKARVRALLRRGYRTPRRFSIGRLHIDRDRRDAFVDDSELPVTDREFALLDRVTTSQGVRRDELLEEVWGEATPETSASLDVVLSRLRRKLSERGLDGAIETVRGYGLRWRGGR